MKPSPACLDMIRQCEGVVLKAYICPAGKLTIGVGHTGPDVKPGMKISFGEAERLFEIDADEAAADVLRLAPKCSQGQLDALTSFVFNLGASALEQSTLLRLHNAGKYDLAAQQFARWKYAGNPKKIQPGLIKRRALETAMYLGHDFKGSEA